MYAGRGWAGMWNIGFTPGPPRRQTFVDAFQIGWAHVLWIAEIEGRPHIIEFGLKGCKARPLVDVVRYYGRIEVGRLDVRPDLITAIDESARAALAGSVPYAPQLAGMTYAWSFFRSIDHDSIRWWSRVLFPIATVVGWWAGRGAETCSTFIHNLLDDAGVIDQMDIRLDRVLPGGDRSVERRPHARMTSRLVSPSDFWCSPRIVDRAVITEVELDRLVTVPA